MNGVSNGTGFLSFNSHPPRLFITAEDDQFDEVAMQHWRDEGFDVTYQTMGDGGKVYVQKVKRFSEDLHLGESYAIIAYGEAATICLDIATKPMPHCCALICYYPTEILHPKQKYPSQLNLVVHLAANQNLLPEFPVYQYTSEEGFAEHDLDQYDKVAAELAWSRSLGALRRGFKKEVDLEKVKTMFDALSMGYTGTKDVKATLDMMVESPYVNNIPTGTGGIGKRALFHFYKDFFMPAIPQSLEIRLISRTSGVDRVVDEMVISFRHSQEMPWILPGVPPTGKNVQIAMVSIIAIRGGKLVHEHRYWDQASVLAQIGAIDPKNVPKALSSKGCKKLPIMGAEAAKKVASPSGVPSNELIPNW